MTRKFRERQWPSDLTALAFIVACLFFIIFQLSCADRYDNTTGGVPVRDEDGEVENVRDLQPGIAVEEAGEDEAAGIEDVVVDVTAQTEFVREILRMVLHIYPPDSVIRFLNIPPHKRVRIYVSFDDGPHSVTLGTGRNYTEGIMKTLASNSVQDGIKAMFCVQTHVKNRGSDLNGQALIRRMSEMGHVVAIHTGSAADHVNHIGRAVYPAYDANGDGEVDVKDGKNALESDMIRAIDRIEILAGKVPKYVRPTYGRHNTATEAVYSRQGLRMILWDVDSADSLGRYSAGKEIAAHLRGRIRREIQKGETEILVLFHDIKNATCTYFDDYLIAIYEGAQDAGKFAIFPTTTEQLERFLQEY